MDILEGLHNCLILKYQGSPSKRYTLITFKTGAIMSCKFIEYEYTKCFFPRELSNIMSMPDLLRSISPDNNKSKIFSVSQSEGKSNSFFFITEDSRLIIKTISQHEYTNLTKMIPALIEHFGDNYISILAQIFMVFSIQLPGLTKVYGIVMRSALPVIQGVVSHPINN